MNSESPTEYVAALHVHSVYSDGSGTVEEILAAAKGTGLDILALTDHNTLEAREAGYEGWYDDTLLIVGDEVSSRSGHCLAFGIGEHVYHRQPPDDILEDIRSQGGHSYIAHPHGRYRPLIKTRDHSWKNWEANSATGLELWSYMFDWVANFHYTRFSRYYRNPDTWLTGPPRETVQKWDELCQRRRVVALGGVDAHAKKSRILPFVVFPYDYLFKSIRTHILCDRALTGHDVQKDTEFVLNTLAEGRCFIAHDRFSDSKGTRFGSTDRRRSIGDEQTFDQEIDLEITLPRRAEISFIKNGQVVASECSDRLVYRANGPGVYRVEARLEDRPWLFTNPIYLRRD